VDGRPDEWLIWKTIKENAIVVTPRIVMRNRAKQYVPGQEGIRDKKKRKGFSKGIQKQEKRNKD